MKLEIGDVVKAVFGEDGEEEIGEIVSYEVKSDGITYSMKIGKSSYPGLTDKQFIKKYVEWKPRTKKGEI